MEEEIRLRNMSSLYLVRGEEILLLFRVGSRLVDRLYVGTAGGHFEPDELNRPLNCVLRELGEETGCTADDLVDLRLRYVTLRLNGGEIRQNYYYFAGVRPGREPAASNEGRLEWARFSDALDREMPRTARDVVSHYLRVGRFDERLYGGVTTPMETVFTQLQAF